MDNAEVDNIYSRFPFRWVIKSSSFDICFKKAHKITVLDEVICSILQSRSEQTTTSDLGQLLGFNLIDSIKDKKYKDLAEEEIFLEYLDELTHFRLIKLEDDKIRLTDLGKEALETGLKYEFHSATVNLFSNSELKNTPQNFSYNQCFNLNNQLALKKDNSDNIDQSYDPDTLYQLDYQLFKSDIFQGKVLSFLENKYYDFIKIPLECVLLGPADSLELKIYKVDIEKPELFQLIEYQANIEKKKELIFQGQFIHFWEYETSPIRSKEIQLYNQLWDWKTLVVNNRIDWSDSQVFEIFKENGDGLIWNLISENADILAIRSIITAYQDYWDWTILTRRFDNELIKTTLKLYPWDFEELSKKEPSFVIDLLLVDEFLSYNWDWEYLTKTLPDEFIAKNVDRIPFDFYLLTTEKFDLFKQIFNSDPNKYLNNQWNWKYIFENINISYLYRKIGLFADKVHWHIVLHRFFNDKEIVENVIENLKFKELLHDKLPENFRIISQDYIWNIKTIEFFQELSLINWETTNFSKGFDTNTFVDWNKPIFSKFRGYIKTDGGFLNLSEKVSDSTILTEFPDFQWNWNGLSENSFLINDNEFLKRYSSSLNWKIVSENVADNTLLDYFSDFNWDIETIEHKRANLISKIVFTHKPFLLSFNWGNIFDSLPIDFWNEYIEEIANAIPATTPEAVCFWEKLTMEESRDYIFKNLDYPWDWTYLTTIVQDEIIIDSFNNQSLLDKWNWKVATRKLDKETILDFLEEGINYWDWEYLLNTVFSIEEELNLEESGQLARIATCLSQVEVNKRKFAWEIITSKFPIRSLYSYIDFTANINVFEWDWDFISALENISADKESLMKFRDKWNWSILSDNKAIRKKFDYGNWGNDKKGCFKNIQEYLLLFEKYWDWKVLSKNPNIHRDRKLLSQFINVQWDWDYLSEYGDFLVRKKQDQEDYLLFQLQKYPINWISLSRRNNITISDKILLKYHHKNLDWKVLSENLKMKISSETLITLSDKPWDWNTLSGRVDLNLDNKTISALIHKSWNWQLLSICKSLSFDKQFIELTSNKPWDWQSVSKNPSFIPSIEVLSLTREFDLDWDYLSRRNDLWIDKEVLSKFEDKWNWSHLSRNRHIPLNEVDFLSRFIDKWDWDYISAHLQIELSKEWLSTFKSYLNWNTICRLGIFSLSDILSDEFKDFLDWNVLSENTSLNYSIDLLERFENYWNWSILKENLRVKEQVGNYVNEKIQKTPKIRFLERIDSQYSDWKGYIYHFAHIDNALEIIKSQKIQSRNKANKKSDAAGTVVHRHHRAHDYARFYFRPHTPTQYYNEFLGRTDDKARNLGYPKCPVPIFFRFSLKEVLEKKINGCFMGDGNMQTNRAILGKFEDMVDKMNYEGMFLDISYLNWKEYKKYSQQEFLIRDELDFSDMQSVEIICATESDKEVLQNLLEETCTLKSKIKLNPNIYNFENPRINVTINDSLIQVDTYKSGTLKLSTNPPINKDYIESGDIIKFQEGDILFESFIAFRAKNISYNITYIDESNRYWFIYQNKT
jgi:hypothetical protein